MSISRSGWLGSEGRQKRIISQSLLMVSYVFFNVRRFRPCEVVLAEYVQLTRDFQHTIIVVNQSYAPSGMVVPSENEHFRRPETLTQ